MGHPLVVNVKTDGCEVYVGRGTPWGNYSGGRTRAEKITNFRRRVETDPSFQDKIRRELRGKILGCHCAPKDCHADILAEVANEER